MTTVAGCRHWGWGAVMVDTPPKGWECPHCHTKLRLKARGRHTYLFGEPRCTACARAWHDLYCTTDQGGEVHELRRDAADG